jgi:hypothetical protein
MISGRFLMQALGALLLMSTSLVNAQEASATIYGTATDAKKALLPGVKVTAVNESTGLQRDAITSSDGVYTIPLLPAGRYTITAEMPGFAVLRITNVAVQVSVNSNVPIVLEPKQIAETVSIEAQNNKIDPSNATVRFLVTNEQVQGLPVLTTTSGRNVLGLLPFLSPGVSPTDVFGTSRSSNLQGLSMSVNGARPESNSYNFAGGNNNDNETNGSVTPLPNPDALQEFTILTNSYPADQGGGVGGIFNAVAKSGTNHFHGNGRYIGINEALNARGFFDLRKPVTRLHTFGGQLGGPISLPGIYQGKNRTFFFVDYEGTRSHIATTRIFTNVLTQKERAGDFSSSPASQRPRDPLTNQPFPGGIIPPERINSISRAYLDSFIPLADSGGRTFTTQLPNDVRNDSVTTNFLHNLGTRDTIGVTVFYSNGNIASNSGALPLNLLRNFTQKSWNVVLNETHTFSSQLINQVTVAGIRAVTTRFPTAPNGFGVAPSTLGFTGINPQTDRYLAIPTLIVSGTSLNINLTSPLFTQDRFKTLWQIQDNLSYTRGVQSFKFGGDVRGFILNSFEANNNGSFTFSTSSTSRTRNGVADFLLGLPSSFNQSTGSALYPRQKAYYFYGMDDWRARPNLTINLGLRYELVTPFEDELRQLIAFRPGERSQRFPNAPSGVLFVGDSDPILGTVPAGGYPTDKNNLAPRLGVAYSPKVKSGWRHAIFGDGKTAIRAGWGVFYDATLGATFLQQATIQPFSVTQTLTAAQITAAGGSFANPYGTRTNPFPLDLSRRIFVGFPTLQPFDPHFRTAYTYQYNFTLQRELPGSLLLEIAYVGSNSFKQNRERQLNPAILTPTASADDVQDRRLFPTLGSIPSQESSGRARYDAGQFRLTRRFTKGFDFGVSYVFQKALDNVSSTYFDLTPGPTGWARSDYDRTHNFVVNYTYDLPRTRLRGLLGQIVNDWRLGGLTQIRSGQPLAIYQELDPTLSGYDFFPGGAPDLVGQYRRFDPRMLQTIVVNGVPTTGNFFFDPNAFRPVIPEDSAHARQGNLGRNIFDGPGINQWDLSIIKRIALFESQRLEVRADVRNLFNQALFDVPNTVVDAPGFGTVTRSGPGRTIQASLKYTF